MIAAIVASDEEAGMQVRQGMTETVLTIGPGHSLQEAAAAMSREPATEGIATASVIQCRGRSPKRDDSRASPSASGLLLKRVDCSRDDEAEQRK